MRHGNLFNRKYIGKLSLNDMPAELFFSEIIFDWIEPRNREGSDTRSSFQSLLSAPRGTSYNPNFSRCVWIRGLLIFSFLFAIFISVLMAFNVKRSYGSREITRVRSCQLESCGRPCTHTPDKRRIQTDELATKPRRHDALTDAVSDPGTFDGFGMLIVDAVSTRTQ